MGNLKNLWRRMRVAEMATPEIQHRTPKAILLVVAILFAHDALAAAITRSPGAAKHGRVGKDLQLAQVPPQRDELDRYRGLHAAAAGGDSAAISRLVSAGANVEGRDRHGRTPLMVAAYEGKHITAKALIDAGADINALDNDRYDLLTIASVLNDIEMVKLAIASGADTKLVTSPYEGTALIAAAHLGHVDVVRTLILGKAPLDHVNNLGWTALIEAIVLGDGGPPHIAIVSTLIEAEANLDLADGNGNTPLALARLHGHQEIADMLLDAGARR